MNTEFLLSIALILLCTKIFGILTRRVHLPQVVGALLAGIVLGPAFLNMIKPGDTLSTIAEIGVIILMFSAGLETDIKQLKRSFKASAVIAVIGVIAPLAGGFLLAYIFGEDYFESIFIGVILTATSVSITVETLQEMGKLKTDSGTAILGAAIIDDILGVIILAVIISMRGGDSSFGLISITLLKIVAFFACSLIGGFCIFELLEYLMKRSGQKRRLSIFALSFCFILAYLSEKFGVADITGAYIAGVVLCNGKSAKYIEEKYNILSYMFFSPVFFVSIGLKTSFQGLTGSLVLFTVMLLIIAILSKIIGCGLGAKLCKYSNKESLQIGVGMVSRGEVALIVADKGISSGIMGLNLFSCVIIVVIITTLITPLLLKMVYTAKTT